MATQVSRGTIILNAIMVSMIALATLPSGVGHQGSVSQNPENGLPPSIISTWSVVEKACSDMMTSSDQDVLPILLVGQVWGEPAMAMLVTTTTPIKAFQGYQLCAIPEDGLTGHGHLMAFGPGGPYQRMTAAGDLGISDVMIAYENYFLWPNPNAFFTDVYMLGAPPSGGPDPHLNGFLWPSAAFSSGNPRFPFIVLQQNRADGGSSIFFTKSEDYVNYFESWTQPRAIVGAQSIPGLNETPVTAVDFDDRIHVAYIRSSVAEARAVYFLRNMHRGDDASWETEPGQRLSWKATVNHDVAIAASREGDTILVAWTATRAGDDDLMYAYSLDGGSTFSTALNLSATAFNEGYPAISVNPDTSTFHVAYWMGESIPGRTNNILYTQASWGDPSNWTTPLSVLDVGAAASAVFPKPGIVSYSYRGNHDVKVAWTDERNSSNLDIYWNSVNSMGCGIVAYPTLTAPGIPVSFSATAGGGTPPYTYSWRFGDGAMGSGAVTSHQYLSMGEYNAVLRIDDAVGNTCFDAARIHVGSPVQLTPGHRLMSFPVAVANDSVESVLSSISGCYDYVRWYDPLDSSDLWKSYMPGRAYNDLTRLDNTMGFWINITVSCSFTPVGTRPVSTTINLRQGWNMVGFPSFKMTYTVADFKADIGLAGVIVEAFDASAAPYYLQRVQDSYVMMAGEGYWVYVPSDGIWTIGG